MPHDATILPRDRVTIVGVLNLTPDSFSDGGRFVSDGGAPDVETALAAAEKLVVEGADWIDVGGESTRPGAPPVPSDVEIARTRPVVAALTKHLSVPVSIDTRKAAVAEAAIDAGARVVNDVSGGAHDPGLLAVVARARVGLVLGHLRGEPADMQRDIAFDDVVTEVAAELAAAAHRARLAGVAEEHLVVDPGIGFGKHFDHNLELLANLGALRRVLDLPLLVGPSRKAFLGALVGEVEPAQRDSATHAACAVAIFAGADAIRVHDVAGARPVAAVARALREARRSAP